MPHAEPPKEALIGEPIANDIDADDDACAPDENNYPCLKTGSEFRHEGSNFSIMSIYFDSGEVSSNGLQVNNTFIEQTVNSNRLV